MAAGMRHRCALLASALCVAGCSTDAGDAVEQGRRLVAQYQCGVCHHVPGVPAARGTLGPSLAHVGRASYIAGHLPNRGDTLARFIASPQSLAPGIAMPDLGVSDEDARAMARYLASLR